MYILANDKLKESLAVDVEYIQAKNTCLFYNLIIIVDRNLFNSNQVNMFLRIEHNLLQCKQLLGERKQRKPTYNPRSLSCHLFVYIFH